MNKCLELFIFLFGKDLTFAKSWKGTGNRHIKFTVPTAANDETNWFINLELVLFLGFFKLTITTLNASITNLTVCHQNNMSKLLIYDGFGNSFRRCSSCSFLRGDPGSQFFQRWFSTGRVPEKVMRDIFGIFIHYGLDGAPIVVWASDWPRIIDKQGVGIFFH